MPHCSSGRCEEGCATDGDRKPESGWEAVLLSCWDATWRKSDSSRSALEAPAALGENSVLPAEDVHACELRAPAEALLFTVPPAGPTPGAHLPPRVLRRMSSIRDCIACTLSTGCGSDGLEAAGALTTVDRIDMSSSQSSSSVPSSTDAAQRPEGGLAASIRWRTVLSTASTGSAPASEAVRTFARSPPRPAGPGRHFVNSLRTAMQLCTSWGCMIENIFFSTIQSSGSSGSLQRTLRKWRASLDAHGESRSPGLPLRDGLRMPSWK